MKVKFIIIAFLFTTISVYAQNEKLNHFEINASLLFWTPTGLHLKSLNSVTQYHYPDGSYLSEGTATGYGPSLAPGFQAKYYFNNNIGLALGFYHINMDNELSVKETDTTSSNYENIASIDNLTLGIAFRFLNSNSFHMYYETGVDFVVNYDLEMQYSTESSDPPDMDATGSSIGLYMKTGVSVKIFKALNLNTGILYNYIPVEMEYKNGEDTEKINEKTNLGGIGLETGLSVSF